MPLHEETGEVVRTLSGGRAWVKVLANSACGACASGDVCGMTEEGYRIVEVVDPIGVRANQEVGIQVGGRTLVGAAMTMYGIPLALLLAGLFGGNAIAVRYGLPADWVSAGAAIGAMLLGFAGLYFARTFFSRRRTFYPTITRIVASAVETPRVDSFQA